MMDQNPLLRLVNVKKHFGRNEVLRGINLDVSAHEVVALIGASGSGKSTLLRTINLLERIDDGQIFLNGEDISDPKINEDLIRSKIGVVFQNYNLFPHKTVLGNVTLASRKVHNISKDESEQRGMQLLSRIGIAQKAKAYPDQLSGGQQQRVAIVRAIASEPSLLLLDEITSALDPQLVGEVLDLVKELKDQKTTIIMATHEMAFAESVSDTVVFLEHGVIAEKGSPQQIFKDPQTQATKDFLSRLHL